MNALLFTVYTAWNSKRGGAWNPPELIRAKESVPVEMSETIQSPEYEGASATDSKQAGDGKDTSSKGTSTSGSRAHMLSLESVMQRHPDRITYMARTEDSSLVVVKCYESSEARDSEASFFTGSLPRFKGRTPQDIWAAASWGIGTRHGGLCRSYPGSEKIWKAGRACHLRLHGSKPARRCSRYTPSAICTATSNRGT